MVHFDDGMSDSHVVEERSPDNRHQTTSHFGSSFRFRTNYDNNRYGSILRFDGTSLSVYVQFRPPQLALVAYKLAEPTSFSSSPIVASLSRQANSTASILSTVTASASSTPGQQPASAPPAPTTTNGPSPWVWAIIGTAIALVLTGLGIVVFLYKKGKFRSLNMKWKLGLASSAQELDGDATWRTGDKPELHGENTIVADCSGPPRELDAGAWMTVEPKELESEEKPVEISGDDPKPVDMPTEFNDAGPPPEQLNADDGRNGGAHR